MGSRPFNRYLLKMLNLAKKHRKITSKLYICTHNNLEISPAKIAFRNIPFNHGHIENDSQISRSALSCFKKQRPPYAFFQSAHSALQTEK